MMTPARFSDLLQSFFDLDTWYTQDGAERAVRSKRKPHQGSLTAAGLVGGARRAGWLQDNATTHEFCLPSFCWLPIKKQRAA